MKTNKLFLMKSDIEQQDLHFTMTERKIYADNYQHNIHWHDYFELEFIYGGSGTHIVNGVKDKIERGSIYLLTPYDFHNVAADNNNELQLININFSEQVLPEKLVNAIYAQKEIIRLKLSEKYFSKLFSNITDLKYNYDLNLLFREEIIKASFTQICIDILRAFPNFNSPKSLKCSDESTIQNAVIYIKRNFKNNISKNEVAKAFYLTPNYFGDLFKRSMGVTYTDYVQTLRLEYAANLIIHSHLNVNDITSESGFHSATYFIRAFRKRYGKTPTQYRKERNRAI